MRTWPGSGGGLQAEGAASQRRERRQEDGAPDLRRAQVGASRQGRVRGIPSPTGGPLPPRAPSLCWGEPLLCVTQGGPWPAPASHPWGLQRPLTYLISLDPQRLPLGCHVSRLHTQPLSQPAGPKSLAKTSVDWTEARWAPVSQTSARCGESRGHQGGWGARVSNGAGPGPWPHGPPPLAPFTWASWLGCTRGAAIPFRFSLIKVAINDPIWGHYFSVSPLASMEFPRGARWCFCEAKKQKHLPAAETPKALTGENSSPTVIVPGPDVLLPGQAPT